GVQGVTNYIDHVQAMTGFTTEWAVQFDKGWEETKKKNSESEDPLPEDQLRKTYIVNSGFVSSTDAYRNSLRYQARKLKQSTVENVIAGLEYGKGGLNLSLLGLGNRRIEMTLDKKFGGKGTFAVHSPWDRIAVTKDGGKKITTSPEYGQSIDGLALAMASFGTAGLDYFGQFDEYVGQRVQTKLADKDDTASVKTAALKEDGAYIKGSGNVFSNTGWKYVKVTGLEGDNLGDAHTMIIKNGKVALFDKDGGILEISDQTLKDHDNVLVDSDIKKGEFSFDILASSWQKKQGDLEVDLEFVKNKDNFGFNRGENNKPTIKSHLSRAINGNFGFQNEVEKTINVVTGSETIEVDFGPSLKKTVDYIEVPIYGEKIVKDTESFGYDAKEKFAHLERVVHTEKGQDVRYGQGFASKEIMSSDAKGVDDLKVELNNVKVFMTQLAGEDAEFSGLADSATTTILGATKDQLRDNLLTSLSHRTSGEGVKADGTPLTEQDINDYVDQAKQVGDDVEITIDLRNAEMVSAGSGLEFYTPNTVAFISSPYLKEKEPNPDSNPDSKSSQKDTQDLKVNDINVIAQVKENSDINFAQGEIGLQLSNIQFTGDASTATLGDKDTMFVPNFKNARWLNKGQYSFNKNGTVNEKSGIHIKGDTYVGDVVGLSGNVNVNGKWQELSQYDSQGAIVFDKDGNMGGEGYILTDFGGNITKTFKAADDKRLTFNFSKFVQANRMSLKTEDEDGNAIQPLDIATADVNDIVKNTQKNTIVYDISSIEGTWKGGKKGVDGTWEGGKANLSKAQGITQTILKSIVTQKGNRAKTIEFNFINEDATDPEKRKVAVSVDAGDIEIEDDGSVMLLTGGKISRTTGINQLTFIGSGDDLNIIPELEPSGAPSKESKEYNPVEVTQFGVQTISKGSMPAQDQQRFNVAKGGNAMTVSGNVLVDGKTLKIIDNYGEELGEDKVALDINSAALSDDATWHNVSKARKIENFEGVDHEGALLDLTENTRFVALSRSRHESGEKAKKFLDINGKEIQGTFDQTDLYVLDEGFLGENNIKGKELAKNNTLSLGDRNAIRLTTRTTLNNQESVKYGLVDKEKLEENRGQGVGKPVKYGAKVYKFADTQKQEEDGWEIAQPWVFFGEGHNYYVNEYLYGSKKAIKRKIIYQSRDAKKDGDFVRHFGIEDLSFVKQSYLKEGSEPASQKGSGYKLLYETGLDGAKDFKINRQTGLVSSKGVVASLFEITPTGKLIKDVLVETPGAVFLPILSAANMYSRIILHMKFSIVNMAAFKRIFSSFGEDGKPFSFTQEDDRLASVSRPYNWVTGVDAETGEEFASTEAITAYEMFKQGVSKEEIFEIITGEEFQPDDLLFFFNKGIQLSQAVSDYVPAELEDEDEGAGIKEGQLISKEIAPDKKSLVYPNMSKEMRNSDHRGAYDETSREELSEGQTLVDVVSESFNNPDEYVYKTGEASAGSQQGKQKKGSVSLEEVIVDKILPESAPIYKNAEFQNKVLKIEDDVFVKAKTKDYESYVEQNIGNDSYENVVSPYDIVDGEEKLNPEKLTFSVKLINFYKAKEKVDANRKFYKGLGGFTRELVVTNDFMENQGMYYDPATDPRLKNAVEAAKDPLSSFYDKIALALAFDVIAFDAEGEIDYQVSMEKIKKATADAQNLTALYGIVKSIDSIKNDYRGLYNQAKKEDTLDFKNLLDDREKAINLVLPALATKINFDDPEATENLLKWAGEFLTIAAYDIEQNEKGEKQAYPGSLKATLDYVSSSKDNDVVFGELKNNFSFTNYIASQEALNNRQAEAKEAEQADDHYVVIPDALTDYTNEYAVNYIPFKEAQKIEGKVFATHVRDIYGEISNQTVMKSVDASFDYYGDVTEKERSTPGFWDVVTSSGGTSARSIPQPVTPGVDDPYTMVKNRARRDFDVSSDGESRRDLYALRKTIQDNITTTKNFGIANRKAVASISEFLSFAPEYAKKVYKWEKAQTRREIVTNLVLGTGAVIGAVLLTVATCGGAAAPIVGGLLSGGLTLGGMVLNEPENIVNYNLVNRMQEAARFSASSYYKSLSESLTTWRDVTTVYKSVGTGALAGSIFSAAGSFTGSVPAAIRSGVGRVGSWTLTKAVNPMVRIFGSELGLGVLSSSTARTITGLITLSTISSVGVGGVGVVSNVSSGKNWDENLGRNVLIGAAAVPAIYAVSVGIPALGKMANKGMTRLSAKTGRLITKWSPKNALKIGKKFGTRKVSFDASKQMTKPRMKIIGEHTMANIGRVPLAGVSSVGTAVIYPFFKKDGHTLGNILKGAAIGAGVVFNPSAVLAGSTEAALWYMGTGNALSYLQSGTHLSLEDNFNQALEGAEFGAMFSGAILTINPAARSLQAIGNRKGFAKIGKGFEKVYSRARNFKPEYSSKEMAALNKKGKLYTAFAKSKTLGMVKHYGAWALTGSAVNVGIGALKGEYKQYSAGDEYKVKNSDGEYETITLTKDQAEEISRENHNNIYKRLITGGVAGLTGGYLFRPTSGYLSSVVERSAMYHRGSTGAKALRTEMRTGAKHFIIIDPIFKAVGATINGFMNYSALGKFVWKADGPLEIKDENTASWKKNVLQLVAGAIHDGPRTGLWMGTLLKTTQLNSRQAISTAQKINSKGAFGVGANYVSRAANLLSRGINRFTRFVTGGKKSSNLKWGLSSREHLAQMGRRGGVSGHQGLLERGLLGQVSGPLKFSLFSEVMASIIRGDVGNAAYVAITGNDIKYWDGYGRDTEFTQAVNSQEGKDRTIGGRFFYALSRQKLDDHNKLKVYGNLAQLESQIEFLENKGNLNKNEKDALLKAKKDFAVGKNTYDYESLKKHAQKTSFAETFGMIAFSRLSAWGTGGILPPRAKESKFEKETGIIEQGFGERKAESVQGKKGLAKITSNLKKGTRKTGETVSAWLGKAKDFALEGVMSDYVYYRGQGKTARLDNLVDSFATTAHKIKENVNEKFSVNKEKIENKIFSKKYTQRRELAREQKVQKQFKALEAIIAAPKSLSYKFSKKIFSFFGKGKEIKIENVIKALENTELNEFSQFKQRAKEILNERKASMEQGEINKEQVDNMVKRVSSLKSDIESYIRNTELSNKLRTEFIEKDGFRNAAHKEGGEVEDLILTYLVTTKIVDVLNKKNKTKSLDMAFDRLLNKIEEKGLLSDLQLEVKKEESGKWAAFRDGKKIDKLQGQVLLAQAPTGSGKNSVLLATKALLGRAIGDKSLVLSIESEALEADQSFSQTAEVIDSFVKENSDFGIHFKAAKVEEHATPQDIIKSIKDQDVGLIHITDQQLKSIHHSSYIKKFLGSLKSRDALGYKGENMPQAALMQGTPGETNLAQTKKDVSIAKKIQEATKDINVNQVKIKKGEEVYIPHWKQEGKDGINELFFKEGHVKTKEGRIIKNFKELVTSGEVTLFGETMQGKEAVAYLTANAWARAELFQGRQVYNKETGLINPVDVGSSGTSTGSVRVRDRFKQTALHVEDAAKWRNGKVNERNLTLEREGFNISDYDVIRSMSEAGISMVLMSGTVTEGMLRNAEMLHGVEFITSAKNGGKAKDLFTKIDGLNQFAFSTAVNEKSSPAEAFKGNLSSLQDRVLRTIEEGKNFVLFNGQGALKGVIKGNAKGLRGEFSEGFIQGIVGKNKGDLKIALLKNNGDIEIITAKDGKILERDTLKKELKDGESRAETAKEQLDKEMLKQENKGMVVLAEKNWAIGKTIKGKALEFKPAQTDVSVALVDKSTGAGWIVQWGGRFRSVREAGGHDNYERTVKREIFIRDEAVKGQEQKIDFKSKEYQKFLKKTAKNQKASERESFYTAQTDLASNLPIMSLRKILFTEKAQKGSTKARIEELMDKFAQKKDLEANQNYDGDISKSRKHIEKQLVKGLEDLQKELGTDGKLYKSLNKEGKQIADKILDENIGSLKLKHAKTKDKNSDSSSQSKKAKSFLDVNGFSDFAEVFKEVVPKGSLPKRTAGESSDFAQAKILAAQEKAKNGDFKDLSKGQRLDKMYQYLEKAKTTDSKKNGVQARAYGILVSELIDSKDEEQMRAVAVVLNPGFIHESQKRDKSEDKTLGAGFSGSQMYITDQKGNAPLAISASDMFNRVIQDKEFAAAFFEAQDKLLQETDYHSKKAKKVEVKNGKQKLYGEFDQEKDKVFVTDREKKVRKDFYKQSVKSQRLMINDYRSNVNSDLSDEYKKQAARTQEAYLNLAQEIDLIDFFALSRKVNPFTDPAFNKKYEAERKNIAQEIAKIAKKQKENERKIVERYLRLKNRQKGGRDYSQQPLESQYKNDYNETRSIVINQGKDYAEASSEQIEEILPLVSQSRQKKQEGRSVRRLAKKDNMASGADHGWNVFAAREYFAENQDKISEREQEKVKMLLGYIEKSAPYDGVRVANALMPLLQKTVFDKVANKANEDLEKLAWKEGEKGDFKITESEIIAVYNDTLENTERTDDYGKFVKVTAQADEKDGKPIIYVDVYANLKFEQKDGKAVPRLASEGEYNVGEGRHEPIHQVITQIQEYYKDPKNRDIDLKDYVAKGTWIGEIISRLKDAEKLDDVNDLNLGRTEMDAQEKAVIEMSAKKSVEAVLKSKTLLQEENSGLYEQIAQSLSYLSKKEKKALKGDNIYEKYSSLSPEQQTKVSHLWVEKNKKEESGVKKKYQKLARRLNQQLPAKGSSETISMNTFVASEHLSQAKDAMDDEDDESAEDFLSKAEILIDNSDSDAVEAILEEAIDKERKERIKTPQQIAYIEEAAKITAEVIDPKNSLIEKTIQEMFNKNKGKVSVKELKQAIERILKEKGAKFVDFSGNTIEIIVHSSEKPDVWGKYAPEFLVKGDVFTVDFGAAIEINGQEYNADMSRVYAIGKPTRKQEKIYKAIRETQQAAVQLMNDKFAKGEKVKYSDLAKESKRILIKNGYKESAYWNFDTVLGHGTGLQGHERNIMVSEDNDNFVEEGQVFTIEPGVYMPGVFQGRVEDDYKIVKGQDGHLQAVSITGESPKEIAVIKVSSAIVVGSTETKSVSSNVGSSTLISSSVVTDIAELQKYGLSDKDIALVTRSSVIVLDLNETEALTQLAETKKVYTYKDNELYDLAGRANVTPEALEGEFVVVVDKDVLIPSDMKARKIVKLVEYLGREAYKLIVTIEVVEIPQAEMNSVIGETSVIPATPAIEQQTAPLTPVAPIIPVIMLPVSKVNRSQGPIAQQTPSSVYRANAPNQQGQLDLALAASPVQSLKERLKPVLTASFAALPIALILTAILSNVAPNNIVTTIFGISVVALTAVYAVADSTYDFKEYRKISLIDQGYRFVDKLIAGRVSFVMLIGILGYASYVLSGQLNEINEYNTFWQKAGGLAGSFVMVLLGGGIAGAIGVYVKETFAAITEPFHALDNNTHRMPQDSLSKLSKRQADYIASIGAPVVEEVFFRFITIGSWMFIGQNILGLGPIVSMATALVFSSYYFWATHRPYQYASHLG
ncbi:MAG: M24 family metallopeptidase, partial [Candidatus Aceula lacicola]|nr:M24 family metallopeptidase [Candidatus Aceula lacicola]